MWGFVMFFFFFVPFCVILCYFLLFIKMSDSSRKSRKRRLSKGWALQSEPVEFEPDDDHTVTKGSLESQNKENRRTSRRKSLGKALQTRCLEEPQSPSHLDDTQLVELYSRCIQLSAQNVTSNPLCRVPFLCNLVDSDLMINFYRRKSTKKILGR